jgi:hypothetical protein
MGLTHLDRSTRTIANSRHRSSTQESKLIYEDNHIFSFVASNYPSEILEGRLYLGDANHAQDKTILQNLKVTHILNVSNNIPCYFEDDRNN